MADRVHRELTDVDIVKIVGMYHAWRGAPATPSPSMGEGRDGGEGEYADVPGFCKSETLDDIRQHGHVLTPGRYVGAGVTEDDEPFNEKMRRLVTTLRQRQAEAAKLDAIIAAHLREIGYGE